jgi:hypothetical protein
VGALRLLTGDLTSSDGEAAQHLLMTHFPGCQPIEEHHSSGRVLQEPTQQAAFKAAGEDGIVPGLRQHGIDIIIGHITKKFAACLANGYIPLAWRAV